MNLESLIPSSIKRMLHLKPPMKIYNNFYEALEDSDTYEDPGVIRVVSLKTKAYRDSFLSGSGRTVKNPQTVQNLFVLSHIIPDRPLNILEIGGACGASYFEINKLLPGRIKKWNVLETPSMVDAGRKLFQEDGLAFYDDLGKAISQLDKLDLLIAQGVLQYMKEPLRTLDVWLELGFAYIYITRTIVGEDIKNPIITKQVMNLSEHGPGTVPEGFDDRETSQPLIIIPLESIGAYISTGHEVLYSFIESETGSMRIGRNTIANRMAGFLLRKVIQ